MESFHSIKFVNELGENLSSGNCEMAQKLGEGGLFTWGHKMAQNLDHMLFAVNVKPPEIADLRIPTNNLYR